MGRSHSPKYKEQARARYKELGSYAAVSRELGIPEGTIGNWCEDLVSVDTQQRRDIAKQARHLAATDTTFTPKQFAKDHGLAARTVRAYIRGVERISVAKPTKDESANPQEEDERRKHVRSLYRDEKMTYNQIHDKTGFSKSTISLWCRDLRPKTHHQKRTKVVDDAVRDQARALYLQPELLTINDIAAKLKVGPKKVSTYCKDLVVKRQLSLKGKRKSGLPKKEHANQRLTDKQVIKMRKVVHRVGKKMYSRWAEKFGVSVSTLSMAARGITFKHVNHIVAPVHRDEAIAVRASPDQYKNQRTDETLVAKAIVMFSEDPVKWDFDALAKWMEEQTGRQYRANHITLLFSKRDPSLIKLAEAAKLPPEPKIIVKKVKPKPKPLTEEQRKANAERTRAWRRAKQTVDEEEAAIQRMIEEEERYERYMQEQELQAAE
jgi:uncharacterized protein YerC/DNA-binding CsgD family transcriptional regulator